jgi:hypothetical protein
MVPALALAAGAVTLLAGWLLFGRHHERREVAPPADDPPAFEAPPPANANPPMPKSEALSTPKVDQEVAADGLGFMPLHDGDPRPPGPLHPHRITPTHQRLFAENRIANALDDATDAQDVAAMKSLLAQYRRDFPEDRWQLQDGYAVIIGCLEHPGVESRAAAERWLEVNNGSTVKRSVLRNCIQPQQP